MKKLGRCRGWSMDDKYSSYQGGTVICSFVDPAQTVRSYCILGLGSSAVQGLSKPGRSLHSDSFYSREHQRNQPR